MSKTLQLKESHYRPGKKDLWRGRQDEPEAPRFHKIATCQDLSKEIHTAHGITWGILGFACDEGVKRNQGRIGAAQGPEAIRRSLAHLPFNPQKNMRIYDFGDITCADGDLEKAQHYLGEAVSFLLSKNIRPIVLGGGHETAWGNYQGIAAAYPAKDLGIVNFDSHFDLRPLLEGGKGSSGTSFTQIAQARREAKLKFDYCCLGIQSTGNTKGIFKNAEDLNVKTLLADEFHEAGTEASIEMIEEIKTRNDLIYASICLDVFAAPFAPGVSSPQPLGLFPWHILPALRRLAATGKVVSLDLVELCPPFDRDDTTAKLAAALISNFIHYSN